MQDTKTLTAARNRTDRPALGDRLRAWLRKNGTGYAFLLPFLILFAVFVIVPVAVAMFYSLTNYNMIQPAQFIGLRNYSQLVLDDDVFLLSLQNTMVFAVITGPIGYFASFLMAWLITLVKRGRGFFSLMFYAPSLTSGVCPISACMDS